MDGSELLQDTVTNLSVIPHSTFNSGVSGHLMMTLFSLFNIATVVGNMLILNVIPKIPNDAMEDSSKTIYMGQAVVDAVASALYFIGPLTETIGEWTGWTYGRLTFCRVIGLVITSLPGISILLFALLNADRYVFITKPMLYSRIVTRKRALCASVTASIFNFTILAMFVCIHDISGGIIEYHGEMRMCIVDFREPSFLPFSLFMFIIPWMITVGLVIQYCHIVKISTNHWKRIKPFAGRVKVDTSSRYGTSAKSSKPLSSASTVEEQMRRRGNGETVGLRRPIGPAKFHHKDTLDDGINSCPEPLVRICFNGKFKSLNHMEDGGIPEKFDVKSPESTKPTKTQNKRMKDLHDLTITNKFLSKMIPASQHQHASSGSGLLLEDVERRQDQCPHEPTGTSSRPTGRSHDDVGQNQDQRPLGRAGPSGSELIRHDDGERNQDQRPLGRPEPSTLRRNLRILRTPFIVTSCFFFSFLPVSFLDIYEAVTRNKVNEFIHALLTVIVAFNGGVNIIIYYFTIKPFRRILKNTLRRR